MEMETIENQIRLLEHDLYNNYNQQKVKELQIMRAKYYVIHRKSCKKADVAKTVLL